MSTSNDIITFALKRIGVYAPGETVADSDAEDCLTALNDMLDSWSNENLTCYAKLEQSVALTVGKTTYTIGTSGGADINLTRPLKIDDSPVSAYIQDTNGNNFYLNVVPQEQWNMIANRSGNVNSNIPDTLFYDPQFPLGKINFWPQPNSGNYTAFWDSFLQLTTFTNLASSLSLPPGYKDALQKNLAIEVWPDFKSGEPPAWLIEQARVAKANVKRTNIKAVQAVFDPELVSRAIPTFNIYSGRDGGMV